MSPTVEKYRDELLRLSPSERGEIASFLLDSLDSETEAEPAEDVEAAWTEEIGRRVEEIQSGRVVPIPGEQVIEELRAKYS